MKEKLIKILESEIKTWDEKRNSKYASKKQKATAHGRWAEARFILEQVQELTK